MTWRDPGFQQDAHLAQDRPALAVLLPGDAQRADRSQSGRNVALSDARGAKESHDKEPVRGPEEGRVRGLLAVDGQHFDSSVGLKAILSQEDKWHSINTNCAQLEWQSIK